MVIRRLLAIAVFIPVELPVMLILLGILVLYSMRWVLTGRVMPEDPMPRWVVPAFDLPFRISGAQPL